MSADRPSHGLVAILLITRSKSGPKLVFHYPAQPERGHGYSSSAAQQPHQDSDDDLDDDDEHDQAGGLRGHARGQDGNDVSAAGETQDLVADSKVLGYAVETLEKLLSPGRWSDGKNFEICLDGTTFVGHPTYANEDGMWLSKPPTAGQSKISQSAEPANIHDAKQSSSNITIDTPREATTSKPPLDFAHISESLDSHTGPSLGTSFASASTTSAIPVEQLTMFHVVFVLHGNTQDDTRLVYEHVAKKVSKALQYCQRRRNYLAVESRNLVALKTKARQSNAAAESILNNMVEGSELAWSLKEIHDKISAGSIADIRLNGMEMSLHIPPQPPTHASTLPETSPTTPPLSPDSALLLLEDKSSLLRQLSDPGVSQLAYFIREHTPTKSLRKLSARLNISLSEIMALSTHLIKWRKARAIAPLHSRNTYVLSPSPSAPTGKVPGLPDLRELIQLYAKKFPALPSLPQMLKVLSGRPIQYGLLIPSKDHRGAYMEILGFLVRFGVVVRLETKGWLKGLVGRGGVKGEVTEADGLGVKGEGGRRAVGGGFSLLSPQLQPVREVRGADEHDEADDAGSVRSAETAVTAIPALSHNGTTSASVSNDEGLKRRQHEDQSSNLILDPLHPSDEEEEEKALRHLISSIDDEELREYMPTLLKYFDGLHALEDMAVAEGLKRARVEEWLGWLRKRGWLQTFRTL
ncbi:Nitrogen permease regulator 3 [Recurvomyces mirabilis]|uniref:Nitrogen permease regulator 3 n=1 Tax=Recurvomyces mirabilis TaxID=574656 RepID=A0AAE0TPN6_9PEZI|nr:Nitrogen permease regulator 3 [Recurvomyces mirabilis]KAK5159776.1 Nitrogen permease regulator 3 [Recurvomyces mirabilis]